MGAGTTAHHDHGHGHAHGRSGNERRLFVAMLLTGGFMGAEVVGGLLSGSLALLADAGHMLTDTASLALAWVAVRLARRPADRQRTYGWHRAQILAAFVNGVALIFIVLWIAIEAVRRLFDPVEVLAGPMLAIAVTGLAVNVAAFAVLRGGDRSNLNLRGAALHVLGDLLGSAAAIAAAVVIMTTGWTPIDPILSVLVALLILRSAVFVVRRSGHVLLEGAPEHLDAAAIPSAIEGTVAEVEHVHHVHAWSLTQERPLVTLHARIAAGADQDAVVGRIKRVLAEDFRVDHATIEIEYERCSDDRADDPVPGAAQHCPSG